MPGDVRANDVYKDRQLLNRLGYGIMDVEWGKGEIGSENIRNFSYVIAQDQDPKFYRRMVYDLIGRYFSNDLAKVLWDKFIDHKWVLSERAGHEVDLKTSAKDWMQNYSHDFLKEWTFMHPVTSSRIRSIHEPNRGVLGSMASQMIPPVGDLLDSGFSVVNVVGAALRESLPLRRTRVLEDIPDGIESENAQDEANESENIATQTELQNQTRRPSVAVHFLRFVSPFHSKQKRKNQSISNHPHYILKKVEPEQRGFYYVRLLAALTGHHFRNQQEAQHYWREVLEHKWYMSEAVGRDVGIRAAALDYFRHLNLLEQVETGNET